MEIIIKPNCLFSAMGSAIFVPLLFPTNTHGPRSIVLRSCSFFSTSFSLCRRKTIMISNIECKLIQSQKITLKLSCFFNCLELCGITGLGLHSVTVQIQLNLLFGPKYWFRSRERVFPKDCWVFYGMRFFSSFWYGWGFCCLWQQKERVFDEL